MASRYSSVDSAKCVCPGICASLFDGRRRFPGQSSSIESAGSSAAVIPTPDRLRYRKSIPRSVSSQLTAEQITLSQRLIAERADSEREPVPDDGMNVPEELALRETRIAAIDDAIAQIEERERERMPAKRRKSKAGYVNAAIAI
jgi:hypothetical protein